MPWRCKHDLPFDLLDLPGGYAWCMECGCLRIDNEAGGKWKRPDALKTLEAERVLESFDGPPEHAE
jgi:hypothetical protein